MILQSQFLAKLFAKNWSSEAWTDLKLYFIYLFIFVSMDTGPRNEASRDSAKVAQAGNK